MRKMKMLAHRVFCCHILSTVNDPYCGGVPTTYSSLRRICDALGVDGKLTPQHCVPSVHGAIHEEHMGRFSIVDRL